MKFLQSRKTRADIESLERSLSRTLVPVTPSPEFLQNLQSQLRYVRSAPEITMPIREESSPGKLTLISLAGMFSILMIAAAGFRTLVAILAAIGLAGEVGKQFKSKKTGTAAGAV